MNNKKSVTIKEVAELANVSSMTVSRVLNDESLVKNSTRVKVNSAIKALNYRPNVMAQKLAGGQGLFISLMYRNPSPAYFTEMLLGALNVCCEKGFYLVVDKPTMSEDLVSIDHLEKRFQKSGIQAVMLAPPLSDDRELISTLNRLGISHVCISPGEVIPDEPCVRMNDEAAAYDMTNFLFDLGHEKIAFIQGPRDHSASHLRLDGFLNAMKDKNITLDKKYISQGDFTYLSGIHAATSLLKECKNITAIFACNDDMAAGAIAAVNQAGLKVPEDISVTGFDDTHSATFVWPPLTTVRQPIKEMGECAIELITQKLSKKPEEISDIFLNHEIIVRGSTSVSKNRKPKAVKVQSLSDSI